MNRDRSRLSEGRPRSGDLELRLRTASEEKGGRCDDKEEGRGGYVSHTQMILRNFASWRGGKVCHYLFMFVCVQISSRVMELLRPGFRNF